MSQTTDDPPLAVKESEKIESHYNATSAQKRFLDYETVTGFAPILPLTVELVGQLGPATLEAAFATAIRDFDILRSSFRRSGGNVEVSVLHKATIDLQVIDLASVDFAGLDDRALDALLRKSTRKAMAIDQAPLLRAFLIRLSGDRHLLHIALHHGLVDELSLQLLSSRIAEAFSNARSGKPTAAWPAPSFASIAGEIELHPESPRGQKALAFWRETLRNAPSHCVPPTDAALHRFPDRSARRIKRAFAPELLGNLQEQAKANRCTLFGMIAGGFAMMLGRMADQRDILFDISVSSRRSAELFGVAGMLMNTVPLRIDLRHSEGLPDAARNASLALARAMPHIALPYDLIYELTDEASPQSAHRVLLSQRLDASDQQLAGLSARTVESERGSSAYDLAFSVARDGNELIVSCEYLPALYDEASINLMLVHLESILAGNEPASLSEVTMPSEPAETVLARTQRIGLLFPDRIAMSSGDGRSQVTYREVLKRAEAIARGLDALNAPAGATIGIALRDRIELWCAILGVWQAGCSAAPVSIRLPATARRDALQSAGSWILLSDDEGVDDPHIRTIRADDLAGMAEEGAIRPPVPPGAVATVMTTSGSTGRPKAVCVPHDALAQVMQAFATAELFSAETRMVSVTDPSFDISQLETLGVLAVGGLVCLAEEGTAGDGEALAGLVASFDANAMQATPFTWECLRGTGFAAGRDFLLLCGGEAANPSLTSWLAGQGRSALNLYGPTETAIWSSIGPMAGGIHGPTLGIALPGERLIVTDREGARTPAGGVGSLHIAGSGLAHGYRADPAKTALAFAPDPSGAPGSRLYDTGDRVRVLPDGQLRFIGRADQQIKLRGFRLEPDGIASQIARHTAVSGCVVGKGQTPAGEHCLIAWIENSASANDEVLHDIRNFARNNLAPHAVPAAFVPVAEFPTTVSQKIDRARLPSAEQHHFFSAGSHRPPAGETEASLFAIWSEIFGHDRFSVEDDFFALGGTSLAAIRVVALIAERLETGMTLADFLDCPTIEETARFLQGGTSRHELPPMPNQASGEPARLSIMLAMRLARELSVIGSSATNMHKVVRLRGRVSPAAIVDALGWLTDQHDALRMAFGFNESGAFASAAAPGTLKPAVHLFDLQGSTEEEAGRLAASFVMRAFDPLEAPMTRFGIFRIDEGELVLAMSNSHLMMDGWSLDLLSEQFGQRYGQAHAGTPLEIVEEKPGFLDLIAWQSELLGTPAFGESLDHWIGRLAELPPRLFERLEAASQTRLHETHLGEHSAARLRACAARVGRTPFACFLACLARAIGRLTDRTEFSLMIPAANRVLPEMREIVGLAMQPVLLQLETHDADRDTLIEQAWVELRAAQRHQICPIDIAVDVHRQRGGTLSGPVGEIHLLWNDLSIGQIKLPGVVTGPLADPARFSRTSGDHAPTIMIDVALEARELIVTLVYRTDFVTDEQIRKLIELLEDEIGLLEAD